MDTSGMGSHVLVFPYPSVSHMKPLLQLTHQLATHGLAVTVLVSPQNLTLLDPLLSAHPSIQTLVLPFPTHPSRSAGLEIAKGLPPNSVRDTIFAMRDLYHPLLLWFRNHPSPPTAIVSDMFLGWTHNLGCRLNIRRIVFSPVSAMAVSLVYSQWRDQLKRDGDTDRTVLLSFPKVPNSPAYPWWQLSPFYTSHVEGDPVSEFVRDGVLADMASWGLVINTCHGWEGVYLDHLKRELGHNRVWAVGPFLCDQRDESDSNLGSDVLSWLDTCSDDEVVYVCFGSKTVLSDDQMKGLALGLEKSGAKFIWCVSEPAEGNVEGRCGVIPSGFEDRVSGRGVIVKGWAPQVLILRHRAVGGFLTHCGWNSVVEALAAGVPLLAWPMGADQFFNATLAVDVLKVGVKVCEGGQTIPNSTELGRVVMVMASRDRLERAQAVEFSKRAQDATEHGGDSFRDLNDLVSHLVH